MLLPPKRPERLGLIKFDKRERLKMNRIELEQMSILELRKLAKKHRLKTGKKDQIIAMLADDFREGPAISLNGASQPKTSPAPVTPDSEAIIWPEVPIATSSVNGDYVSPPWLDELTGASKIGHVELMGPAGSGKTLAVHHLAVEQGKRLAIITADGGLRKRDLVGQRELIGGSTIFTAAEFAAAAKNGDWALIDEANMAEPDAMAFINGMTDRPNQKGSTFQVAGQTIEVHPDFRCFMTRNPNYIGTRRMNEALRDRFWTIEVPPLAGDSLKEMFKAHGMDEAYIKDATFMIDTLFQAWKDNRISYQVSPRRALATADLVKAMLDAEPESPATFSLAIFRKFFERSILTKIDAQHDIDAVSQIISTGWTALNADSE